MQPSATRESGDPFLAWAYLGPEQRHSVPQAPFAGIRVGVKDVIDVEGMPTSAGFGPYAGCRAPRDASAVALLRAAGARIVGKTVSTEFAGPSPAATRNPHDPTRTPGGSSSGSAAAVAAGMADVALGTQTAGSLIRPAAYCGVVGFKPGFDVINRSGLLALAPSLDTIGVIAADVNLAARAAFVAAGWPVPVLSSRPPGSVLICWTGDADQATDDACAALSAVRDELAAAGARVSEMDWPKELAGVHHHHRTIMVAEAVRSLAAERLRLADHLSQQLTALLDEGAAVGRTDYLAAQAWAEGARRWFDGFVGEYDVVVTFSAPGVAPRGLGANGSYVFNSPWTLLHVPCLTLPAGVGEGGMPVGVQLVGGRRGEADVLGYALWVEARLSTQESGGAVTGPSAVDH